MSENGVVQGASNEQIVVLKFSTESSGKDGLRQYETVTRCESRPGILRPRRNAWRSFLAPL